MASEAAFSMSASAPLQPSGVGIDWPPPPPLAASPGHVFTLTAVAAAVPATRHEDDATRYPCLRYWATGWAATRLESPEKIAIDAERHGVRQGSFFASVLLVLEQVPAECLPASRLEGAARRTAWHGARDPRQHQPDQRQRNSGQPGDGHRPPQQQPTQYR